MNIFNFYFFPFALRLFTSIIALAPSITAAAEEIQYPPIKAKMSKVPYPLCTELFSSPDDFNNYQKSNQHFRYINSDNNYRHKRYIRQTAAQ